MRRETISVFRDIGDWGYRWSKPLRSMDTWNCRVFGPSHIDFLGYSWWVNTEDVYEEDRADV